MEGGNMFNQTDYDADDEQEDKLNLFKNRFSSRLQIAAKKRRSYQNVPKQFRRLDSFARLLEGNSICAAVYYHANTNVLWLASNKIHHDSRLHNNQIHYLNSVFSLISQEDLSAEIILVELTKIIYLNLRQEKRFEIGKVAHSQLTINDREYDDIKVVINEWLNELFESNLSTKEWREQASQALECEDDVRKILLEVIKKISRFVRDFLKIRDFLTYASKQDASSTEILSAIRNRRFEIIHVEGKDVHAEMRILSQMLSSPTTQYPYIGISKLCCDHCGLALNAFGAQSRGIHGQGAKWPAPGFLTNNPTHLKKYVGEDAYSVFRQLSPKKQREALGFISSKESNPTKENARHGRYMSADSSDSDIEFGAHCSDEEQAEELRDFPLGDIWWYRDIKKYSQEKLERLVSVGLTLTQAIALYKEDRNKFTAIASKRAVSLIQEISDTNFDGDSLDVFEKLSAIYDENKVLFWSILNDESDLVVEHGLDEMCDRYNAKTAQFSENNSDGEENDYYGLVSADVTRENGWDYDSNSDDSDNYYTYREDHGKESGTDSSSDEDSELSSDSDSSSDEDSELSSDSDSSSELIKGLRSFRFG
jgi:clumping factor A